MEPTSSSDRTAEQERWRRIEAIFAAAVSRPVPERAQFLAEACRDDESLRRIVDSLIANADAAMSFMESPAIDAAAKLAADDVSRLPGHNFGAYQLGMRIGVGGMGEVYRARDTRLGRDVAIKLLPVWEQHPQRVERFRREARLLAALNHPNVASIYEFEEADGVNGLVMELVEGPTLADRIAGGPLPLSQALAIAVQIADAVQAAHAKGIIHRDLKPANIKAPPVGPVKVLDFGLAKVWSDTAVGVEYTASRLTLAGSRDHIALLGTPSYMSPEQAQGKSLLDTRTDVWAFGCVLYEMLTGGPVFSGASPLETISSVLEREPEWGRLPDETPPPIQTLLENCLDKRLDRRPTDLVSARRVLQQCIADLETRQSAAATVFGSARMRRWLGHNRAWVAALLVAVASGVLVAIQGQPLLRRFSRPSLAFKERDWILIADFENLTRDEVFDRSLRAALEVSIAQSRFVNVFPTGRVQDALRRMQRPSTDALTEVLADEVAVREGIRGVLTGSVAQIGNTYSLTTRLVDPQTRTVVYTLSKEAKNKNQILAALGDLTVELRRHLGESFVSISARATPLPQATTFSLEALKLYADSFRTQLHSDDDGWRLLNGAIELDPDFAMAHAELGRRYYLKSERATRRLGEEHFVKAITLLDRLSPRERLWIPAIAEDARGNRRAAVDAYKAYLVQYPDDARAWFRLGWTQMAGLGQFDAAILSFTSDLALYPSDTAARVNLATCYSGSGRYAEAVAEYRRSFEIDPTLLVAEFVNHEFGFTLARVGDRDAAADAFRKMTATPQLWKQGRGHRSLALLSMLSGQYTTGIAELRAAASINHTLKADVSEVADRIFLTRGLAAQGKNADARAELKTLDELTARMSLDPGWLAMIAKLHARSGNVPRALELVSIMSRTAGDATADSTANRDRNSDQAEIDFARGEAALAEGKHHDAVERLESACLLKPSDGNMIESYADALAADGRLEDAARRYEQLLALRPLGSHAQEAYLAAHVRLGTIYERLGRGADANRIYEQVLTMLDAAEPGLPLAKEARTRSRALHAGTADRRAS